MYYINTIWTRFFLNVHNFQKSVFSNMPLLKGQKMIKKESNSIEINKVY